MRRLIAESPQLGKLIDNNQQLSMCVNASDKFDDNNLYNPTGSHGICGVLVYRQFGINDNHPVKDFYAVEAYASKVSRHRLSDEQKKSDKDFYQVVIVYRPLPSKLTDKQKDEWHLALPQGSETQTLVLPKLTNRPHDVEQLILNRTGLDIGGRTYIVTKATTLDELEAIFEKDYQQMVNNLADHDNHKN